MITNFEMFKPGEIEEIISDERYVDVNLSDMKHKLDEMTSIEEVLEFIRNWTYTNIVKTLYDKNLRKKKNSKIDAIGNTYRSLRDHYCYKFGIDPEFVKMKKNAPEKAYPIQ